MPVNSSLGQYFIDTGRVVNLPNYKDVETLPTTDPNLIEKASLTPGHVDWEIIPDPFVLALTKRV